MCVGSGAIQTLEADVRSKFQTKRAKIDADKGTVKLLPFDELAIRWALHHVC